MGWPATLLSGEVFYGQFAMFLNKHLRFPRSPDQLDKFRLRFRVANLRARCNVERGPALGSYHPYVDFKIIPGIAAWPVRGPTHECRLAVPSHKPAQFN